ncbi:MAG: hypothetical protein ACC619_03180, partial [Paracoccaceae bacterium]
TSKIDAKLRRRLNNDFSDSATWAELTRRLRLRGFDLRLFASGLVLTDLTTGARLCDVGELGLSHARLSRKFRAPFPGKPRAKTTTRVMSAQHA